MFEHFSLLAGEEKSPRPKVNDALGSGEHSQAGRQAGWLAGWRRSRTSTKIRLYTESAASRPFSPKSNQVCRRSTTLPSVHLLLLLRPPRRRLLTTHAKNMSRMPRNVFAARFFLSHRNTSSKTTKTFTSTYVSCSFLCNGIFAMSVFAENAARIDFVKLPSFCRQRTLKRFL